MGITIDEAIKQLETYTIPCGKYKAAYDLAVDTMRKYQLLQAEYTKRLRADMVGMLMDLYLLFEDCQTVEECFGILNKRIADLKGEAQE